MSNHLAIATVTAALGQVVHASAQAAVSGVSLQFGRPVAPAPGGSEHRVYVYLFQATPNAALRNTDLPSRNSSAQVTQRPRAALDLIYLLSFVGDDRTFEPERMLGAVARDLHAQPILSPALLRDVIASHSELEGSDLDAAIERVKLTPAVLPLEEMSKLWSVFVQTPHLLSTVYQASVVLIDALETPTTPLPVLRRGEDDRGVETQLGQLPSLDSFWIGSADALAIRPRIPSLPSAELGQRVVLKGARLAGDLVQIELTHPRLPALRLVPAAAESGELTLAIPDDADAEASFAAGIYTVSVAVTHAERARTSNALPLRFAPQITGISPNPAARAGDGSATLELSCRPDVLPEQSVTLLLADREISAEPLAAASASLTFTVEDAPSLDQALLRIRIDGVDSLPFRFDADSRTFRFDDAQRITIT